MTSLKLGRQPRRYDPRVPHLSMLQAGRKLSPPPTSVDYRHGVDTWGMMLNDQIGDCTCAAVYHALQVWSVNSQPREVTEPDARVLELYERFGYVPGDMNSDQGAVEQTVLRSWLTRGVPLDPDPMTVEKLAGYVEIDPRNVNDIKLAIAECGVVYLGFSVPAGLFSTDSVPAVWDSYTDYSAHSLGGHAVVWCGYDAVGPFTISWGQNYQMTWAFVAQFVDEVYALIDRAWVAGHNQTPFGLTLDQIAQQMQMLRYNA